MSLVSLINALSLGIELKLKEKCKMFCGKELRRTEIFHRQKLYLDLPRNILISTLNKLFVSILSYLVTNPTLCNRPKGKLPFLYLMTNIKCLQCMARAKLNPVKDWNFATKTGPSKIRIFQLFMQLTLDQTI